VLFMGVAMSITAMPVLASIARERGLAGTTAGEIATALASAWVTMMLGLQPVFGGFLAGLTMRPRKGALDVDVVRSLDQAGNLLLPLFFIVTGLSLNLGDVRGSASSCWPSSSSSPARASWCRVTRDRAVAHGEPAGARFSARRDRAADQQVNGRGVGRGRVPRVPDDPERLSHVHPPVPLRGLQHAAPDLENLLAGQRRDTGQQQLGQFLRELGGRQHVAHLLIIRR
jgi:hypothetical protein